MFGHSIVSFVVIITKIQQNLLQFDVLGDK